MNWEKNYDRHRRENFVRKDKVEEFKELAKPLIGKPGGGRRVSYSLFEDIHDPAF